MQGIFVIGALIALLGQKQLPERPVEHETVRVVGVYATQEGRTEPHYDEGLKRYAELLAHLPFDTFHLATDQRVEAPYGQETMIPIDGQYSMVVSPSQTPDPQKIAMDTRIEMLKGTSYLTALGGRAEISPGKALLYKGLPREQGELAVILGLVKDQDEQQPGQSSSEEDSESEPEEQSEQQQQSPTDNATEDKQEEPEEAKADEEKKEEAEPAEEQQMEEQDRQSAEERSYAEEQASKEDLENIDAILQHLEDVDKAEQKEARNPARRFVVRGDWW
ncbi:MAG: hypothetical protein HYV27_14740 [Candidatus Hydrogenedentes bacterium]|nr:hypothetical protein [Candidatus Hydrogenedentota bacterium]